MKLAYSDRDRSEDLNRGGVRGAEVRGLALLEGKYEEGFF